MKFVSNVIISLGQCFSTRVPWNLRILQVWGCIHIDTSTSYGLFIRGKLVWVECSRSLVQAQTLVIQSPLKIGWKLWSIWNFLQCC